MMVTLLSIGLLVHACFFMQITAENNWKFSLGRGFYLPEEVIDVYKDNGKSIFETLKDTCYQYKSDSTTVDKRSTFTNTRSFYKAIAVDTQLSFSYVGKFTLGATLRAKVEDASFFEEEITGTSIIIYNQVSTALLDKDCRSGSKTKLSEELIKDLRNLPTVVEDSEERSSWEGYRNFLRKYGSHVVTHTYLGTSIKHWTFAKKNKQYTSKQINVKSCAKFGLRWLSGVKACAGVTEDHIEQVKDVEVQSEIKLQGGSESTRNLLLSNRSDAVIKQFLNEAQEYRKPIRQKYTAIWEIIKDKFFSSDRKLYAIGLNLEQYYLGFLQFGCSVIPGKNDMLLRRFQLSPKSKEESIKNDTHYRPHYWCVLEKEGCHSDADCHRYGGFQSNCDGRTCVEHLPASFGSTAKKAQYLTEKKGDSYRAISQSFDYNITSKDGICNYDYFEDDTIWELGMETSTDRPDPTSSGNGTFKLNLYCLFVIYLTIFF